MLGESSSAAKRCGGAGLQECRCLAVMSVPRLICMPGTGRLDALSTICLIASGSPPLPPPKLSGRLVRSHYSKSSRNISHFVTLHIIQNYFKARAHRFLTYLNKQILILLKLFSLNSKPSN